MKKHSKKRDAILDELKGTLSHPGAQWIYDRLKARIPDLSLATVYRNLRQAQQEGDAVSLGVIRGEERFDGDTRPHPHAVCENCGRVVDLSLAAAEGITLEPEDAEGFIIDPARTLFLGFCPECGAGDSKGKSGL